jgi:hypothetical protein
MKQNLPNPAIEAIEAYNSKIARGLGLNPDQVMYLDYVVVEPEKLPANLVQISGLLVKGEDPNFHKGEKLPEGYKALVYVGDEDGAKIKFLGDIQNKVAGLQAGRRAFSERDKNAYSSHVSRICREQDMQESDPRFAPGFMFTNSDDFARLSDLETAQWQQSTFVERHVGKKLGASRIEKESYKNSSVYKAELQTTQSVRAAVGHSLQTQKQQCVTFVENHPEGAKAALQELTEHLIEHADAAGLDVGHVEEWWSGMSLDILAEIGKTPDID